MTVDNDATPDISDDAKAEDAGFITPDDGTPKEEVPEESKETGESEDKAGEEPPKESEKAKEEEKPTEDTSGDDKGDELPRGVRKRIDKVVAARHKAEEEAAYWRGKAEAAEAKKAAEGKEEVSQEDDTPSPADYETEEEYISALTDYKVAKALKEFEAKTAEKAKQQAKEAAEREKRDAFAKQIDAARNLHDDYDEVVYADNLPITPEMFEAIQASEQGAEIAYKLGKNPTEAARIAGLPPIQAARAIWSMEKGKPSSPSTKTNKVSGAPDPIPASVGGAGGGEIDDDSMSTEAWMKREIIRDNKKRGIGG